MWLLIMTNGALSQGPNAAGRQLVEGICTAFWGSA